MKAWKVIKIVCTTLLVLWMFGIQKEIMEIRQRVAIIDKVQDVIANKVHGNNKTLAEVISLVEADGEIMTKIVAHINAKEAANLNRY